MKIKSNISGFSIIEVMVAIFIFSMGMASIFMVISSSINLNNLNKNQIIASNLAREEIELIRNIRDSNYETFHKWNWIPNNNGTDKYDSSNFFIAGEYYTLENDFNSIDFPFKLKIINNFGEGESELKGKMRYYNLYLDSDNHYTYNSSGNTKTIFYRYLKIEELKDGAGNIISNTIKVKSKVIWYSKGYHEFEINTILADFNRL